MSDFADLLFASIVAQNEAMAAKYRAMTADEMRAMLVAESRRVAAVAEAESILVLLDREPQA